MQIGIDSSHDLRFLLRQTPGGQGVWNGNHFTCECSNVDFLVVVDDLAQICRTSLPPDRRILVVTEPPEIVEYRPEFLNQFGIVISPYTLSDWRGAQHVSQSGLPWFYGLSFEGGVKTARLSFDELVALRPAKKLQSISVVCSTKSNLPRHQERLELLNFLAERLKDRIVIAGRGFTPVNDKADVIAPYAYHLVLENNDIGHFWTEKLADAYLGWAFPIFSGTPKIGEYFSADAFASFDLCDHKACLSKIEEAFETNMWERNISALEVARSRLLYDFNIFEILTKVIAQGKPGLAGLEKPDLLKPNRPRSLMKEFRRSFRRRLALFDRSNEA